MPFKRTKTAFDVSQTPSAGTGSNLPPKTPPSTSPRSTQAPNIGDPLPPLPANRSLVPISPVRSQARSVPEEQEEPHKVPRRFPVVKSPFDLRPRRFPLERRVVNRPSPGRQLTTQATDSKIGPLVRAQPRTLTAPSPPTNPAELLGAMSMLTSQAPQTPDTDYRAEEPRQLLLGYIPQPGVKPPGNQAGPRSMSRQLLRDLQYGGGDDDSGKSLGSLLGKIYETLSNKTNLFNPKQALSNLSDVGQYAKGAFVREPLKPRPYTPGQSVFDETDKVNRERSDVVEEPW